MSHMKELGRDCDICFPSMDIRACMLWVAALARQNGNVDQIRVRA